MTILDGTRLQIFEAICDNPGLSKTDICDATDLAWGTIHYHLKLLHEHNHVRSFEGSGQLHIFPASVSEENGRWIVAMRDQQVGPILKALADTGEARLGQVADVTGVSRKTVRRHLGNLCDTGVVSRGFGRKAMYWLARR